MRKNVKFAVLNIKYHKKVPQALLLYRLGRFEGGTQRPMQFWETYYRKWFYFRKC